MTGMSSFVSSYTQVTFSSGCRTHMQDLKDVTNNVHYENFRYNKLANVSATDGKPQAVNNDR